MAKRKSNEDDINKQDENDWRDADDSFGLPDVSYDPVNRDVEPAAEPAREEETSAYKGYQPYVPPGETGATSSAYESESAQGQEDYEETSTYVPHSQRDEEKAGGGGAIIALLLIVLVLVGGGAAGYFLWYKPMQEKEAQYAALVEQGNELFNGGNWEGALSKYEEARKLKPNDKYTDDRISLARVEINKLAEIRRAEEERMAAERAAQEKAEATPRVGSIETISARTGRYFVVVASNIDGDLAMDYAKKHIESGKSFKIIEPFGTSKFHRITIQDFETFNEAQARADELKAEMGDGLWVLKY
jgi:tetratricopeptide (TPR) repeat protein